MVVFNYFSCCGIHEIVGIQGTLETPESIVEGAKSISGSHFIFSSTNKRGDQLMRYIRKKKLGTVYRSPACHNTNSGNKVRLYVWNLTRKHRKD
jgi:hypothetical protein